MPFAASVLSSFDLSAQSSVGGNTCVQPMPLLLGAKWLLMPFLSELGNSCCCILKAGQRNEVGLVLTWTVCFHFGLDKRPVMCVGKELVRERWRREEASES